MKRLAPYLHGGGRRCMAPVVLAVVTSGCGGRGIVGVTSSKNADRDAMSTPDAITPLPRDAMSPRADGGQIVRIDDCLPVNPANLSAETARALLEGAGDATGMRFLYPYDGTVYPQGIPGPLLMWDGPLPDVVYVRIHSNTFDYRGCLKPTGVNAVTIPSGAWDAASAATKGAADPFTVELKVSSGGAVHGPISEQLVVAPGALGGSVYYMTTSSPLSVGGVLRVRAGNTAEAVLTPPSCAGCHSVSANGTRLLAYSSGGGSSFTVPANAPLTPLVAPTPGGEFAGVHPDGSVYVASAHPMAGAQPRTYAAGPTNAGLYETSTGALIADSGIPAGAGMPSFSADGRMLAFTDLGAGAGHTIASMQFTTATRKASAYTPLFSTTAKYLGFPAFLPDGSGLVFTQGDASDFSGGNVGLIPTFVTGPATDLFIIDVVTRAPTLLAQAVGFRSLADAEEEQTYLPAGKSDLHMNYYPAVSPVASGGYAWVLFDSERTYGNLGVHRQVWGAAISLSPDGTYSADPSHPAFYLPGQNLNTPNFRAVPALDP